MALGVKNYFVAKIKIDLNRNTNHGTEAGPRGENNSDKSR